MREILLDSLLYLVVVNGIASAINSSCSQLLYHGSIFMFLGGEIGSGNKPNANLTIPESISF